MPDQQNDEPHTWYSVDPEGPLPLSDSTLIPIESAQYSPILLTLFSEDPDWSEALTSVRSGSEKLGGRCLAKQRATGTLQMHSIPSTALPQL